MKINNINIANSVKSNMKISNKRARILIIFVLCLFVQLANANQPEMKLRYKFPATNWMTSALPIGNGVFGGMFFGGVASDTLQFNDKTLWSGSTSVRGAYQSFGNLILRFSSHSTYSDYSRELNLDSAIGKVNYIFEGVTYQREYLASNPDSVIVIRISPPGQTGKLSFNVSLTDAHSTTTSYSAGTISFAGSLATVSYNAKVKVINEGGTLTTRSTQIAIANADAVTIILAGATNFSPGASTYKSGDASTLNAIVSNRLNNASAKSYQTLKANHLNDYQPLFNRVKLDLDIAAPNINTDELIRSYKYNSYLDLLYYQYGRYLMLGSSRGIALPSNLQGLWNNSNSPAWQCDIHNNINVEMNYWPAENTNLSECHLPFLNYINTEATKVNSSWQKMASTPISTTSNGEYMAGYTGWTMRTQNNIFGYSDWNWNRPANAWYCMHLWQHFRYTNDTTYLKNVAFPTMKSACEFWFGRLKSYATNQVFSTYTIPAGTLYAPDEWSPEQGNWEDNVAYAQQLIWELFDNTLKAAKLVNADAAFVTNLSTKLAKLDNGVHIGSWGQIREWTTQSDSPGNTHRHLSPLIALYPGNNISYFKDTANVKAAIVMLNSRGDGGTGWSRAWKISCWARLQDGNHAYKLMKAAQNLTTYTSVSMTDGLGGVYENLLDAHPSFQIDGNFGFTAGVTEMLVQSNQGFIHLLPALPDVWPNGNYSGLKAIGNFTIDLNWKNSLPTQAKIYSGSGDTCRVYFPSANIESITDNAGNVIPYIRKNANLIAFPTFKDQTYNLSFSFTNAGTAVITPYVQINADPKIQTSSVSITTKSNVILAPESTTSDGVWSWTGPNSFKATTREITLSNVGITMSGNYIAIQTINGKKTTQVFTVNVIPSSTLKQNVVAVGDYYIRKAGTQLYWTNTATTKTASGGAPLFAAKGSGTLTDAQGFTLSLDGGFYKIVSKADGRYVNEKGNFGTNAYSQTWNTYNLYSDSIFTAIQITQNAATQEKGNWFFNINSANAIVYSTNTTIDETKDLVFEFLPYTLTALNQDLEFKNRVWANKTNVYVKCDEESTLLIYSQLGILLKTIQVNGEKSFMLPNGIYFIAMKNNNFSKVTKVVLN